MQCWSHEKVKRGMVFKKGSKQEVASVKLAKYATQYEFSHSRVSDYRGALLRYPSRENCNLSATAVHTNVRANPRSDLGAVLTQGERA